MAARIRNYCISATLLATSAVTSIAIAHQPDPGCCRYRLTEYLFPTPNCEIDRSAPAMHGPLSLVINYGDKVGYWAAPKFINDLGTADALALELNFGVKVFRAASTWGHAINDDVMFKLTAEFFSQKPDFLFDAGHVEKWLGQWDFGADIRYRFSHQRGLDSVHFSLQSIFAQSDRLLDVTFGGPPVTNIRQIRGARELGAIVGARIQPWTTGYVDVDLAYDLNYYDVEFEAAKNTFGFGGSIAYHQNLSERLQLIIAGTERVYYREYLVGLKWIARNSAGSLLELSAQFSADGGNVAFGRENVLGVGIHYSWGGDVYGAPPVYIDPLNRGLRQELVDYTNVPVLRPPQVLVTTDQVTF